MVKNKRKNGRTMDAVNMQTKLPHEVEVRLKAVYASLKSAEKKAADFLVKDSASFATLSIMDVAKKAGCSEATVCRFVKKLAYDSYGEFKEALNSAQGEAKVVDLFESYSEKDTCVQIMQKTFSIAASAISDTLLSIDNDQFQLAFEHLKRAKRTACFGAGDANIVADAMYYKLIRIGKQAFVANDTDGMNIICTCLKPGEVAICNSHSGATRNIVGVAKLCRKKGVTVIAITNYPMSQLAKNADVVLFTASFTESKNGEVISKRVAELCIVESLYVSLIMSDEALARAMEESNESILINKY